MMLTTRLTKKLEIKHPVISAPMAFAAGGKLAAAVTKAGGLGLVGGAYCDPEWIEDQILEAGNTVIGCGFITWALKKNPDLLDQVLGHAPKAIFLSFDNPEPFTAKIKDAGSLLICQVQTLKDAKHAVHCGADIIVAQGSEAGGHGQGNGDGRGTLTLVPEFADWLAKNAPAVLLCAAGGIGDGRGLAAALMLGADGALVGSRFWASKEALVHPNLHKASILADGDATLQTSTIDVARKLDWPERYQVRVLKNEFSNQWHGNLDALREAGSAEADRWTKAWAEGNTQIANTVVGEVTGLITDIQPVGTLLNDMVSDASRLITQMAKANAEVRT